MVGRALRGRWLPLVLPPLAAAAVLLAGLELRWWGSEDGAEPARPVSVTTRLSPRLHLFGDIVSAELEVLLDRRLVHPAGVRVEGHFQPYEQVGRAQSTREDVGSLTRLHYRFPLWCVRRVCLPELDLRVFRFEPARVVYASSRGLERREVGWTTLAVASRVTRSSLEDLRFRAQVRPLPAVSYGVSPRLLQLSLLAAAGLLVLTALALLARLLPARHAAPAVVRERPKELSALERSLALVRETAGNGEPPAERRALERLARELCSYGRGDLARDARRLAWGTEPPAAGAVGALALTVERTVVGGG